MEWVVGALFFWGGMEASKTLRQLFAWVFNR